MDKYLKKNQVVNGYTVKKKLGEGRYGIAYLATNEQSKVVIKQLKNELLKETRKKLFYEEKILKSLNHSSIPKFIGKFQDDLREGYILEYVEGKTFSQLVKQDEYSFTKEEIYEIARKLIDILQVLHEQNIVHRDIRLPNVIVRGNQELTLIDFGLARYMDNDRYKKEVDYWYLGDFLIHLYYTSYEPFGAEERPWYEELDLNEMEKRFLKKLMGILEVYHSLEEIKSDLSKIEEANLKKKTKKRRRKT